MQTLMGLDDIVETLDVLDADMDDLKLSKVKMLVVGGVYMLANFGNRLATKDIDASIIEPEMSDEQYSKFFRLVDFLAKDRNLDPDWLNDKIAGFLEASGPVPQPLTPWDKNERWKHIEIFSLLSIIFAL